MKERGGMTQGGTRTRKLDNGLPYSNQLSYRVIWQLSGRVQVFKAELPWIWPKWIPSWHVWWGGCDECEAQGSHTQIFKHAPDLKVRPYNPVINFLLTCDYPIFTSQVERVMNEWMKSHKNTLACPMFQCFRVSIPALRTYWRLTPQPESAIFEVSTLRWAMFSCQNWQLLFNVFCHFWQLLASILELLLYKYCPSGRNQQPSQWADKCWTRGPTGIYDSRYFHVHCFFVLVFKKHGQEKDRYINPSYVVYKYRLKSYEHTMFVLLVLVVCTMHNINCTHDWVICNPK